MCGRYSVDDFDHFKERFDVANFDAFDFKPRYNVAPSQVLPVIVNEGESRVEPMRWGLIPSWAKEASIGYKMINAKAETVAEKSSYKKPLQLQRCLVPATGFYEWKKEGNGKQPYYFHLKDEKLFAFAGLYSIWHDTQGNEVKSYTIITTKPNKLLEPIHDRMPVILKREDESMWLNPDITEPARLLPLLAPYPDSEMETYPVSAQVNSPKNDTKEVQQRISL
jgi:putative SOS response-associated peptidase YedK